jgi:hypothetical protein
MNVINPMPGGMIVLGMFGLYVLVASARLPPYSALPPFIIAGFVVGVGLFWIAVEADDLLATFAVKMVLISLGTALTALITDVMQEKKASDSNEYHRPWFRFQLNVWAGMRSIGWQGRRVETAWKQRVA